MFGDRSAPVGPQGGAADQTLAYGVMWTPVATGHHRTPLKQLLPGGRRGGAHRRSRLAGQRMSGAGLATAGTPPVVA